MEKKVSPHEIEVKMECSFFLDPIELEESVTNYTGEMILTKDSKSKVGWFSIYDFKVSMSEDEEENTAALEAMDSIEQETLDAYEAVRGSINKISDGYVDRIVHIERLIINPQFRGNGIATWFLHRILKFFENAGMCLVTVLPSPLDDNGKPKLSTDDQNNLSILQNKLIKLYENIGFKQIANTQIWYVNLGMTRKAPPWE